MKKELKELLARESGRMKLSAICYLQRWTKDGIGEDVDKLTINFDSPTGSVYFYSAEIENRTTDGIAQEIAQHTKAFAEKWAEEEAKKALGGRMEFRILGGE